VYSLDTSLDYLAKLGAKLELELGIPVDIVPITELDPHSKHNILTRGKIIFEKTPGIYEALLREAEDEITAIELEEPRKRWLHSATKHTARPQTAQSGGNREGLGPRMRWNYYPMTTKRSPMEVNVVSIPTT